MFELNISCTKDIEKLIINFADGTSVVQEKKPNKSAEKLRTSDSRKKSDEKLRTDRNERTDQSDYLDLDADYSSVSQEVLLKPDIQEQDRPVNVAEELQNFDF